MNWYPWGNEAFAEAVSREKPLLLSIGYAACHWCHVMAHESFDSPKIAELMNELFVNVKVDREERPDVDAIYMNAVMIMGQQGGWPLTVFLTPKGNPYWGGTYFPPNSRYGHPGFPEVLHAMSSVYHSQKRKLNKNVKAIFAALEKTSAVSDKPCRGLHSPSQLNDLAQDAVRMIDPLRGGTVGAPKFPQPTFLNFLWRAYRRTGSDLYKHAVLTSLTNICQGGIFDHLGGGFARYSTDEQWLVPHFEKMLYDNAQLVEVLSLVWQDTADPLFEARVTETVEWCLRDLRQIGGGFAGTLDADSEGVEGKFYVWSEEEIDTLLGKNAGMFKKIYDVTPSGNWDGSTILNRTKDLSLGSDANEAILAECRSVLLNVRNKRIWPDLDDKILADWNGLMISALALASVTFGKERWLSAAEEAYQFIRTEMMSGERIVHSWRQGSSKNHDVLDDYAQVIRAALLLHQVSGKQDYLNHALAWLDQVNFFFWDKENGAYFFSPEDAHDLITRTRSVYDNATPAGNGTMIENLATLFYLTGDQTHRERAEKAIGVFTHQPSDQLINMTSLLNGIERLTKTIQVVLVGDMETPEASQMKSAVYTAGHPDIVLSLIPPGEKLSSSHPAAGKSQINGTITAYVCVGPACGPPATTPVGLQSALTTS